MPSARTSMRSSTPSTSDMSSCVRQPFRSSARCSRLGTGVSHKVSNERMVGMGGLLEVHEEKERTMTLLSIPCLSAKESPANARLRQQECRQGSLPEDPGSKPSEFAAFNPRQRNRCVERLVL